MLFDLFRPNYRPSFSSRYHSPGTTFLKGGSSLPIHFRANDLGSRGGIATLQVVRPELPSLPQEQIRATVSTPISRCTANLGTDLAC